MYCSKTRHGLPTGTPWCFQQAVPGGRGGLPGGGDARADAVHARGRARLPGALQVPPKGNSKGDQPFTFSPFGLHAVGRARLPGALRVPLPNGVQPFVSSENGNSTFLCAACGCAGGARHLLVPCRCRRVRRGCLSVVAHSRPSESECRSALHHLELDMQPAALQGAAGRVLRAPAVAAALQADAHGGGRRPVLPDRALLSR